MELTERLEFDHDDRRDIYNYIESHGSVRPEKARRALDMEPRAFGHHVAILKRDGILVEVDGSLRIAYEDDVERSHETDDGFEFTIRRAREEDLTGLVGVIRQSIGDGTYVDAETVADVIDHEEVLMRSNELHSRIFFVATVDNEVVGWVNIGTNETEKLDHTAKLTVGVLEEYRGHGIGSHLLERGLDWADDHGIEKLYNSVPAVNEAAIEFLESHGWETEAVREDHYKVDGEYVDEVMMATSP
ncbi:MAG: N-acetyltransferase family protein [Haloarculaceae archaeon]